MAIQIGKYKRPGIFIEEYDKSILASTSVGEGITNMVIGVSKKGPINTPIKITNTTDLESIFGQLDRGLERKGSYFHRTITKMLETASVYAINLLSTDDTLDKIEYRSISASSEYNNDIKREGPYRKFFDTTGFWKRDTESFLTLVENNYNGYTESAFSLTNLSDKYITVFIVKTSKTGFDRTLIEWYGSQEKLPTYVNANDYASDYMVDVIVVGGDWSDYQNLSVDNRWSQYFNTSGLVKNQLSNFANDRNITLLAYYEGLSLIPYFRDANGTNIFIETTINKDTDKTGLFCAFNSDLVESDSYNGMLDIIGQTIAGVNEANIDFLSYKETIAETIEINAVPLDLPGNVTAMLGGSFSYLTQSYHAFGDIPTDNGILTYGENRTAYFGENYVYDLKRVDGGLITSSASLTIQYSAGENSFAIIGGNKISINSATTSLVINASDYTSATVSFILDSTGLISTTTPTSNDIVLGYAKFTIANGVFSTYSISDLNINSNGFVDYKFGAGNTNDYFISLTQSGTGIIKIEFPGTNTQNSNTNYAQHRKYKMFLRILDLLEDVNKNKMTICLGPSNLYKKVSMETMTISNIIDATTSVKSFVLNTGLTDTELVDIKNGYLVIYTEDNEFILGRSGLPGYSQSISTTASVAGTASGGVVSKYSKFYDKFYDGIINTGDYFYDNRMPVSMVTDDEKYTINFIVGSSIGLTYSGKYYISFDGSQDPDFSANEKIIIPSSSLNLGTYTIKSDIDSTLLANELGFTGEYAYEIYEIITNEIINNVDIIYNVDIKHYLKMYLDNANDIYVSFVNENLDIVSNVNIIGNNTFYIQSAKSNFKQTIEIEIPAGYVQVPNKILVNSARYTEIKTGDYLAAWYDTTESGMHRKLTRILSKRQYSGDSTLTEISCDSKILTSYSGSALQTTRYTPIDSYVDTYKAITLKGFRIRQASIPDGTEARQNTILNLVAKGTPLFKAICNKEAIDFRYLIDSFGLGLIEKSKQQLVDICGNRLDCFGFINMPSMKSFKNSASPYFLDTDGVLDIEYIAKGGDPESSPMFLYSFGDGDGCTSTGYFLPYLTINDNGRPTDVPPSAWAATTYMRKHVSNISGITPWTIAAGVKNGRITNITSTEMNFTASDIEFLNMAQMNPICFKRNRGNVIETENTAQVNYKSALSYIHSREVLIELERELSRMLLDYQWKYNTPDVRSEIKLRADIICETYVSKNGLYNYFNKMDEENNTTEIIDNQIGVLDTYVEVIKGMGVIVNNITILSTGAIEAGGFMNQ